MTAPTASTGPVILERKFVPKDGMLIHEGDKRQQAYLIQSGKVRVFTTRDHQDIDLAQLGAGQIVGEMALLMDGKRTASVQAIEDCNLIVINRQEFEKRLHDTDRAIQSMVNMMTQRIKDANDAIADKRGSLRAIIKTAEVMVNNTKSNMPIEQKYGFDNKVLPKLEALIEEVEAFQSRYGHEVEEDFMSTLDENAF
ncbi:MAG: cyclic nucleotide-binding domain-containing protein [Alphaproteobacteria bacterium]|nr:cyclic nucleotide-binding domain-containing protein [Alphaproteobacteria bacterium]